MALQHCIIAATYYPLRLTRTARSVLTGGRDDRLRVLLYHDIPPEDRNRFANQLRWLSRRWSFATPEHFAAMLEGREPIRGRQLLVTFDDGLLSNFEVATAILKPLGIRAIFFVVSDLVEMSDREKVREFMGRCVQPGTLIDRIPPTWDRMGWSELEQLLEMGHTIGGHTRSHARLSTIDDLTSLEDQIAGGADVLAARLGVAIEHFAFPFGNLASFSPTAMQVARRRFKFVHSGLRGRNDTAVLPHAIRRDAAATQDAQSNYSVLSHGLIGGFLEGSADPFYSRARRQLDQWAAARQ